MKDMRKHASYRAALEKNEGDSEIGVDLVFFIDKSLSMTYNNRHYFAVQAVRETIRNLNIQDRFFSVATSKITDCLDLHKYLGDPNFQNCKVGDSSIWNYNGLIKRSLEELKKLKIFTPQYDCLQKGLAYATKKIKDKTRFLLERNLLMADDSKYLHFQGTSDFVAGFERISEIYESSKSENSTENRSKILIVESN